MPHPPSPAPPAWIVVAPDAPDVSIWGVRALERLRRQLVRLGCPHVGELDVAALPAAGGPALLVRSDFAVDERLLAGLLERQNAALVAPSGQAVAARVDGPRMADALALLTSRESTAGRPEARQLALLGAAQLAPAYSAALRKPAPPYLYDLRGADLPAIEARLFDASYKGVTDLVTKWLWPAPAAAVTRALARRGVHPNVVTLASWLLAILALLLFARGAFGWGLLAAWWMTFLDTVDGKLARVTLSSSRLGHVLDHGLDLVHPPFWWLAWGLALPAGHGIETLIVVGGYFVGRALEGIFLLAFGSEIHCWRPIDSLFRTITARRNPNLILLTVGSVGGRPDLGFGLVALWTLVSCAFHGVRIGQAFAARARGERIAAWDEGPAPQLRRRPEPRGGGGSE